MNVVDEVVAGQDTGLTTVRIWEPGLFGSRRRHHEFPLSFNPALQCRERVFAVTEALMGEEQQVGGDDQEADEGGQSKDRLSIHSLCKN